MNHPEIEKALMNYTSPSFTMPPAIVVYADAINRTPLFALQQLAQYIGDGKTKLDVDRINKEMKVRYQQYIDTPYTPIRNTYRTLNVQDEPTLETTNQEPRHRFVLLCLR